jgi:serine/threonine-protein kinase
VDSGRWQQVEELFHAALERPGDERTAFVERSCGGDAELRAEVESLLAASPAADERIGGAVAEALELALDGGLEGQELGPYRLTRKIGEGGLATVYLAERADRQYRMQVAVKVVKHGMATADILRRLRQERQILASLQHPNIAQLLDGGTTGEGRPYFVMEYIDGEPVDVHCDRRRLTVRERLGLFRTVCSAVHHAHQNLVIHRDIKPSNVLVSADGVPKLLDFGIAKLLRPEDAQETVARTVTGLRLLTPEYASPEQVRGEPLTTATDQYSLGVLLYRLLTGRPPYRLESGRPQEVERVICGEDPPRPSTVVRGGRSGARRLAGDLDNIVLTALRKEPGRRYASVQQLSEDLARHLDSRPVTARRDTFAYRTGKFVRRHRVSVVAAAALLAVLLGGIVATTRATLTANAQRQRAERHLAESRQVTRFLIELFEISDPGEAQGNQVTAREILDEGAARIAFELADQPLLRAELMSTMGRVYQNLGLLAKARELLEEALDERRRNLGEADPQVAVSLGEVADVVSDEGDDAAARELLEQALSVQRRQLGEEHADVATTLDLLAGVVRHQGEVERAEELYREALAMRRKLLGEDHPDTLDTLDGLAVTLFRKHDLDGAEAHFRQVLELRRQSLGEFHPKVAQTRNNLAVLLNARGDFADAEAEIREVLALRLQIYGERHPAVAMSYNNLAAILQAQQRFEEAEAGLRRALETYRGLLGDEHPRVIRAMSNLAVCLRDLGRTREAEELLLEALDLRRKVLGEDHPDVARNLFQLATLRVDQQRPAEAERLLEEALRIQREVLPSGDYQLSYPLVLLAELLVDRGDCPAALPLLHEAAEIRRQLPAEHPDRKAAEELLDGCRAAS